MAGGPPSPRPSPPRRGRSRSQRQTDRRPQLSSVSGFQNPTGKGARPQSSGRIPARDHLRTGAAGPPGGAWQDHQGHILALPPVVCSLAPQRSAGRGVGRGGAQRRVAGFFKLPPLPSPLLHRVEEREAGAVTRYARSSAPLSMSPAGAVVGARGERVRNRRDRMFLPRGKPSGRRNPNPENKTPAAGPRSGPDRRRARTE